MTLPSAIFVIRWLVRDTFRQARANGIFWLMLAVSGVCIVFCLSVSTVDLPLWEPEATRVTPDAVKDREKARKQGVDVINGKVLLAFGAVSIDDWRTYRNTAVRYLEMVLLGLVADTGGILLALIWTAGFLPTFLETSNASVLLAKPIPRWMLLLGKFLGVLVFVAFQATVLVGGVWLALAIKTGVWDMTCLLAIPVLLVHFAVFFSVSALLAVTTRSTVACVFGSLLFWFLCFGMNMGRHYAWTLPEMEGMPGSFLVMVDAGYWLLPKPADLGVLLTEVLRAEKDFVEPFDLTTLKARGGWHPGTSLLASILFGVSILGLAARELVTTDY
jgi:hypothetical protein